jgi:hypothetical protein
MGIVCVDAAHCTQHMRGDGAQRRKASTVATPAAEAQGQAGCRHHHVPSEATHMFLFCSDSLF